MHKPIKQPTMMESRRRLDLIMVRRLLMPGIVSVGLTFSQVWSKEPVERTENTSHAGVNSRDRSALSGEFGACLISLPAENMRQGQ